MKILRLSFFHFYDPAVPVAPDVDQPGGPSLTLEADCSDGLLLLTMGGVALPVHPAEQTLFVDWFRYEIVHTAGREVAVATLQHSDSRQGKGA